MDFRGDLSVNAKRLKMKSVILKNFNGKNQHRLCEITLNRLKVGVLMSFLKLLFIVFCLCNSGCVLMTSVSVSEIHPNNSGLVKARVSDYGFLHIDLPPTLNIQPELRKQCPNGTINGIQTTLSMREFLLLQYYTITATGYCKN